MYTAALCSMALIGNAQDHLDHSVAQSMSPRLGRSKCMTFKQLLSCIGCCMEHAGSEHAAGCVKPTISCSVVQNQLKNELRTTEACSTCWCSDVCLRAGKRKRPGHQHCHTSCHHQHVQTGTKDTVRPGSAIAALHSSLYNVADMQALTWTSCVRSSRAMSGSCWKACWQMKGAMCLKCKPASAYAPQHQPSQLPADSIEHLHLLWDIRVCCPHYGQCVSSVMHDTAALSQLSFLIPASLQCLVVVHETGLFAQLHIPELLPVRLVPYALCQYSLAIALGCFWG